ncbi:3-oxoacyl-[acyl-carrier-protein] synthase III C-terminal domain-containing protein [Streptomyces sp. NPDC101118]|uniref:3-oxoacyl-[acyl-carrier-protein] synthase III C-terminal domain-containing protein n=1 Tax=Streptomyces sp. NPDC101118 TaxID=3366109 RepID=UPI0038228F26
MGRGRAGRPRGAPGPQRILDGLAAELALPAGRVLSHIERCGNTAAASVPVLPAPAAAAGTLVPGARGGAQRVRRGAGPGGHHAGPAPRAGPHGGRLSRRGGPGATGPGRPAAPGPGPPSPAPWNGLGCTADGPLSTARVTRRGTPARESARRS